VSISEETKQQWLEKQLIEFVEIINSGKREQVKLNEAYALAGFLESHYGLKKVEHKST